MSSRPIAQRFCLLSAVALVSALLVGCTLSDSVTLPNSATATQSQTVTNRGDLLDISDSGASDSTDSTTVQNPLTGILALARVVSSVEITGCSKTSSKIVPNLAGVTLGQAQASLILQGLVVGNMRWAYSATVPAGTVISQDPAAGKIVSVSTAINLLLSLGPQLAAVPDVTGRPQAEAQTALSDAAFTLGAVTQSYSLTVAAGLVISQDPAAGTLAAPASAVNLVVSQGPQPLAVPNVVGATQADAGAAIVAAGFAVGTVVQGSSPTVPAGIVMGQNPAAGAMMIPGTAVDLVVSQGPQSVPVPDVVGRAQSDAQATIAGAGFSMGTVGQAYSATVPAGSVISQDPAAGAVMLPGTAVNLVVSQGPQPVAVPDVAGKTQADAETAITSAGLVPGTVTLEYSDTVADGGVIRQEPVPGTLLPPGSAVNLIVAKKTVFLCDYYPFAVGNKWVTAGNNWISSEVTDAFVVNGFQCWKVTAIDHGNNDKVTYSYVANANGWMIQYKTLDELYLLPGLSSGAEKVAPLIVTPGQSFVATFNGMSLSVTPVKGRLSDFVGDTSACPYGDVQDTVALKLGDFTLVVFGRNLGSLYYNYFTKSGFYSEITIAGGC